MTGDPRYPTPKDKVDFEIYVINQEITALEEMRMDNATADFVLAHTASITALAQRLDALASDIHQSVHKRAAE